MENNFFARAIDFLFPLSCAGCGKFLGTSARCANMRLWCVLCDSFSRSEPQIKLCENGLSVYSAMKYDSSPVARAIDTLKYKGVWDVAEVCAWWMIPVVRNCIVVESCGNVYGMAAKSSAGRVVFVPAPLHPLRFRERGFNQSELIVTVLASFVAEHFLCSVDFTILRRIKHTRPQAKSLRKDRLEQMSGAFCATALCDSGALYILIDDVVTTGSTLEACADALRAAGVRRVIACTAAAA